jgi:putative hemolysin
MLTVLLELTVVVLLVLANGLLAGGEIAVVTARPGRLRQRVEAGDAGAAKALDLINTPNRFLSTVQIGITAVAVLGGAFGGARMAGTLAPVLAAAGVPAALADEAAFLVVVVFITYLMLVVGELAPKRIALRNPEWAAARAAGPMLRLSVLATPLVRLLSASTELALRLVPTKTPAREDVTEDEIRALIAHAAETGVLEATEQRIVDRLFRLSDRTLGMIMTPRDRVVWLDARAGPAQWRARLGDVRHTRYLVADGELDRFIGYVSAQELARRCLAGEEFALEPALRRPHVLPEWTPAFRVLERFQWSSDHIAVVADGHGGVAGIVTLHDVMEGIVGEIPDLHEAPVPGVVQREDGSWLVDGALPFREFVDFFDAGGPEEAPGPAHVEPAPAHVEPETLHDFTVARLGAGTRAAAAFSWRGLRLEVVDMDGRQVDKVLVERVVGPDA